MVKRSILFLQDEVKRCRPTNVQNTEDRGHAAEVPDKTAGVQEIVVAGVAQVSTPTTLSSGIKRWEDLSLVRTGSSITRQLWFPPWMWGLSTRLYLRFSSGNCKTGRRCNHRKRCRSRDREDTGQRQGQPETQHFRSIILGTGKGKDRKDWWKGASRLTNLIFLVK